MNIILVMSDTYRYDNLSCYGPTMVKTPSLDRFAKEAHVFTNAYLGSFPTIPNRLDIMSGRFSFIDREWCPLPPETVTVQQILSASGITTELICDNPHLIEMGFNYERGYDGWEWIRGQESDRWQSLPKEVALPDDRGKNRSPWILRNYLRNRSWWKGEADRFAARSVTEACRWLEQAAVQTDRFFLHVDLFDPHEPWDAPRKYVDLYDPGYDGTEITFPHYEFWRDFLTEAELNHVRAIYMAEATMVDHWFGVLLDKIEELGLTANTAVIFTSDHGYLFGEHDLVGKSRLPIIDGVMYYEAVPMYDDIRRVPLLIRLPGQTAPQQIDALVQPPDLMPTILEMAELIATESFQGQARTQALQCGVFYTSDWKWEARTSHGKSLMPLMRREVKRLRDIAVCSNTLIHHNPILAKCAVVTEDGWCFHYAGAYGQPEQGGTMYISKLIDHCFARTSAEPTLYNLNKDPDERSDVIGLNEALAREIHARYVRWLEEVGTPDKHLAGRRKLRP